MRSAGLSGKGNGGAPITTRKPMGPDLRPDLVNREFKAPGLNWLSVADVTYVRTRKGLVCATFVTDVSSQRIVEWALCDSMRTEVLPLQALNKEIVCARETSGLVHYSGHGWQYVSIVYDERLSKYGIAASSGAVGDCYDNAVAENVNGSYKNELNCTSTWNDGVDVDITTFESVDW